MNSIAGQKILTTYDWSPLTSNEDYSWSQHDIFVQMFVQ